jgi:uncharacterized membrane protein YcaP (DUF421 family)
MELQRIAVRAAFAYLVLLGLLRTSGKRTVGQGTPFDFVLALIMGDLIDDALWAEVPVARFAVAAGVLTLLHTLVSAAAAASARFDRLVSGPPAAVMETGRAQRMALRAERISERELERMLRQEGLAPPDWPEVKRGLLEVSGELSLQCHSWAEPPRKGDARRLRERRP